MSSRWLCAALVVLSLTGLTIPEHVQAQGASQTTTQSLGQPLGQPSAVQPAYRQAATWLFDLYAGQSVRLSIANAIRNRPPGTEQVLAPQLPIMVTALARHRDAFIMAMARPLQAQFNTAEIASLLQQATSEPLALDDVTRQKLVEVDADFRRESQTVIRAMTTDIGLMIATSLSEQRSSSP
jgi:hypothetical protein